MVKTTRRPLKKKKNRVLNGLPHKRNVGPKKRKTKRKDVGTQRQKRNPIRPFSYPISFFISIFLSFRRISRQNLYSVRISPFILFLFLLLVLCGSAENKGERDIVESTFVCDSIYIRLKGMLIRKPCIYIFTCRDVYININISLILPISAVPETLVPFSFSSFLSLNTRTNHIHKPPHLILPNENRIGTPSNCIVQTVLTKQSKKAGPLSLSPPSS